MKVRSLGVTLEQKKPAEAERKENDRQLGSAEIDNQIFRHSRYKERGSSDDFYRLQYHLRECGEYGVPTAGQRCCLGGGAKHSILLIKLINEEVVQASPRGSAWTQYKSACPRVVWPR